MLNEDKIRVMTKLALYEQDKGKEAIKSNNYYKDDYVGLKIINTIVTVTIAYLFMITIWVMYKADFVLEQLVALDIADMGIKLIGFYLIILIVYLIFTYVMYSYKYIKMSEKNRKYADGLKELYLIYKREEKLAKESKAGGFEDDDRNFDI